MIDERYKAIWVFVSRLRRGSGAELGSRLIDFQSQKMTVAARATAERKVFAHQS